MWKRPVHAEDIIWKPERTHQGRPILDWLTDDFLIIDFSGAIFTFQNLDYLNKQATGDI